MKYFKNPKEIQFLMYTNCIHLYLCCAYLYFVLLKVYLFYNVISSHYFVVIKKNIYNQ